MNINKIIDNINNLYGKSLENLFVSEFTELGEGIEEHDSKIYILHNDWNEICYLENNKIFRKSNKEEYGIYNIKNNKLYINWENWSFEKFYLYTESKKDFMLYKDGKIKTNVGDDDSNLDFQIYLHSNIYYELYEKIYILDKNLYTKIILKKNNDIFYMYYCNKFDKNKNNKIIYNGNYEYYNNILILKNKKIVRKYKKLLNSNYIEINNYEKIFFEINHLNNFYDKNIIFNKLNNKFYDISNFKNNGIYKYDEINKNKIKLYWNNGNEKVFDIKSEFIEYDSDKDLNTENNWSLTDLPKIKGVWYDNMSLIKSSVNDQLINNSNIILIKPISILLNDKILFSNISLCKNKIILTSLNYKKNSWIIENIKFNVNNCNIIKRGEYANDDYYEVSLNIILELELQLNNLILQIFYENNNYEIYLEQLNIIDHKISAMTLFKDDYLLLENYIKYYEKMGIEVFFLYYNGIIEEYLIDYINKINIEVNVIIYLIEWNYIYWYYYEEKMKHHCAQIMAICDSFNILKNYSKYVLYNDLDEYFLLDYGNFNNMINEYNDIDIFIFKNQFCKMGVTNISYKDFSKLFNLTHIIEGNYWDKYREKNLVKLEHIKVMGIHHYFENFNIEDNIENNIKSKVISKFYHITNFIEKDRTNLMTEYIM